MWKDDTSEPIYKAEILSAEQGAMSWGPLLRLLALTARLLRFVRADADLTLLWAEWQGRRPGEDALPPLCPASPGSGVRSDFRCPSGWPGASGRRGCAFLKGSGSGWKGPAPLSSALVPTDFAFFLLR